MAEVGEDRRVMPVHPSPTVRCPPARRQNDPVPVTGVAYREQCDRVMETRGSSVGNAARRLLLEAAEEIVSSSLELLCVPNVLVGLLFVIGQPLADPAQ